MEKITVYKINLPKALNQLEQIIKDFEKIYNQRKDNEIEFIIHRDSLIKRFEFCYELTWKFLKEYLKQNYAIELASPKKVFLECFTQKIINKDELDIFLKIMDERNQITHDYDEAFAEIISTRISKYFETMKKICTPLL